MRTPKPLLRPPLLLDGTLTAAAAILAVLAARAALDGGASAWTLPDEARAERQLVVVDGAKRRMRLYEDARVAAEYDVVLGEIAGCKERRDDRRTPCGTYFVVEKLRVPETGPSAMFGGYWMRLNYPGLPDAARGLAGSLVDPVAHDAIATAWRSRQGTPQDTALGSGIGIHSFAEDWETDAAGDTRPFSWGCVVMHPGDIAAFFDRIRIGTMVLLR